MNFNPYTTRDEPSSSDEVIAQGPVAALEIIKNLGTNGGGFFNVNGAHPFANPTPFTNILGMLAIVLVPAALTNTFGRMIGQPRQGWMLYAVMVVLFVAGLGARGLGRDPRRGASPARSRPHRAPVGHRRQHGRQEVRFGVGGSTLTAVVTSNTATGSYNAMADSFTALGR